MLPQNFDRYQIISKCGSGGMAAVYKAFDPQRQQQVALKVLMREFMQDPEFRARFKREIDIHSSFKHEAVVPIYGYGQYQGQLYLVLRYMAGGSLQDRLEGGKTLPLSEVVRLLKRITPALDAAHQQNIIHRDMKPSNILHDEQGLAYICDFGIARLKERPNITMVEGGAMIGSPAYMSPEQSQTGRILDGRCDLYSLGVMVYEMLTGQLPYHESTPYNLALAQATKPIPDILVANPDLPPACKSFIIKALAKKPEERFASGAEMAEDLAIIAQPLPPSSGNWQPPVKDRISEASVVKPVAAVSSLPGKHIPQPAPQPRSVQVATPLKKAVVLPSSGRLGTSFSDFFRRTFGLAPSLPRLPVPGMNYITLPAFLHPLTGWLGLPSTIALSPKIPSLKILLILAAVLALIVGSAAVCYFIFRVILPGITSSGQSGMLF
jgi:serine/threonine protein kinase